MDFHRFKWYLPRSLYGRAALIILVPILITQVVVFVAFIQRHYEDVTRQMTQSLLYELEFILSEVNAAENLPQAIAGVAQISRALALETRLPADDRQDGDPFNFYDLSGRVVVQTINDRIGRVIAIDLRSDKHQVRMWVDTNYGPMFVAFARSRVSASNPHQFLVLMVFVGVVMFVLAYWFLRKQLRPISHLARAADAFGKGQIVQYRPSGATEVRLAGNAFLDMRTRIERQIGQRTTILSGVSHDLRTPLTRLKLGLAMLDDTQDTRDLSREVQEMEYLLDEFLAFVKGDALDELVETDPTELVRSVVERTARTGGDVRLEAVTGHGQVMLRPTALARVLDNLISNALRYGRKSRVSVRVGDQRVQMTIEDDGPGIPAALRAEALRPFVRLDAARNQNSGASVGLGLSIAKDIVQRHGGSLELGESRAMGGLKVDVILPR